MANDFFVACSFLLVLYCCLFKILVHFYENDLFKILVHYVYKTEKRNLKKHFFEFCSLQCFSNIRFWHHHSCLWLSNKRFWRLFVSEAALPTRAPTAPSAVHSYLRQ